MQKQINRLALIVILGTLLAGQAQAQQWCQTKVSNLFLNNGGDVLAMASARGDYLQVCNINQSWKGVAPPTCASWLSLLRSGVARAATMTFYYAEPTACTAIPPYGTAPAPGYVMLMN
jgi:hypothetical protein